MQIFWKVPKPRRRIVKVSLENLPKFIQFGGYRLPLPYQIGKLQNVLDNARESSTGHMGDVTGEADSSGYGVYNLFVYLSECTRLL